MTARIDDELRLSVSHGSERQDRIYSAEYVASILDGAIVLARRTALVVSYGTATVSPTVYFTALNTADQLLVARTTSGVALGFTGLWEYTMNVRGITDFYAVWDEGDPTVFVSERVVVDT